MSKLDLMPFDGGVGYVFHCPGCNCGHAFYCRTDGAHPSWSFDGNLESPTFSPSLLNTLPPEVRANADPMFLAKYGDRMPSDVCHLFVRAGMIQYLADCTHHLAGQTVAMEDVE